MGTMLVESIPKKDFSLSATMRSQSLVMDSTKRPTRNTGLEETHGEPTGESMDSSEFSCTRTTLELKKNALPEFHLTPRQRVLKKKHFSHNSDFHIRFCFDSHLNIYM